MGTSCVALSIKNIKTRASREMTSRKKMGGGTLPSTGMWQGEVFAISDCLVGDGITGKNPTRIRGTTALDNRAREPPQVVRVMCASSACGSPHRMKDNIGTLEYLLPAWQIYNQH